MARKFNYKYLRLVEKHGRQRNICIIGEQHWNKTSTLEEADLIRKLKPEYVLMESISGMPSDALSELRQQFLDSSMGLLLARFGQPIDSNSFKKMIAEIERQIMEKYGAVTEVSKSLFLKFHFLPTSLRELKSLPAYALPDQLLELMADRTHVPFGDFKSSPELTKPALLFCAAGEVGAKLAPCDSKYLQDKTLDNISTRARRITEQLGTIVKDNSGSYAKRLEKEQKRLTRLREIHMAQAMVDYVTARKTKRPIIVIVGRAHVKSGRLQKILRKNNLGYACFLDTSDDDSET